MTACPGRDLARPIDEQFAPANPAIAANVRRNSACQQPTCERLSTGQGNKRKLPPVCRFAPMRCPAERMKPGGIGIGIQSQIIHLSNSGKQQAMRDIAGKIELPVTGCTGGEEPFRPGTEALAESPHPLRNWPWRWTGRLPRRSARAPRPAVPSPPRLASSTPPSAPRHPAWAAPTTPAARSASSTGAQSAVTMPSTRPGVAVTSASASGKASLANGASTASASAEWTCFTSTSAAPGRISDGSGGSGVPGPRPAPVQKPCGTPASAALRSTSAKAAADLF